MPATDFWFLLIATLLLTALAGSIGYHVDKMFGSLVCGLMALGTMIACFLRRCVEGAGLRSVRPQFVPPLTQNDYHKIAFLIGGGERALCATIVHLVHTKDIQVSRGRLSVAPKDEKNKSGAQQILGTTVQSLLLPEAVPLIGNRSWPRGHPVELAVISACSGPTAVPLADIFRHAEVSRALRSMEDSLVDDGLLLSPTSRRCALLLPQLILGITTAAVCVKVCLSGWGYGLTAGFAAVGGAISVLLFAQPVPRLTSAAETSLDRFRGAKDMPIAGLLLSSKATANMDPGYMFALRGNSIFTTTMHGQWGELRALFEVLASNGSDRMAEGGRLPANSNRELRTSLE